MSSPQRCPGELEEEWSGAKRVCLRVQHEDLTTEPKAATLECLSVDMESRDASNEVKHATVGSSAASLGATGVTKEAFVATVESKATTMESTVVGAILEDKNATLGVEESSNIQVSVIIPVYNGAKWLDECLQAVLEQDFRGTLEISVFDDASTDNSRGIAESWRERLRMRSVTMVISGHNTEKPRGVGFAKNKAVAQSSGRYLCFQDADDVMMPQRVRLQYEAAVLNPDTVVGCRVRRIPEGSTERYTRWINTLSPEQLLTQVYTSHGPTVVMPTWFCSRHWFQKVGPFDEGGKGVPEDLLWFYRSLRQGGGVIRVDECLLIYRYHEHAATHSVLEETIWNLRVDFLEERVLGQWDSFTIWNAGKQGRKLYRSLTSTNQKKV
ncbi:hypothetical protein PDJAM_G00162470 [Pangasius djambal]|uniref:Uncharacterized protein n=1 Tax=Pangasius djambal TaxID=1691987 RepID=A0ACC5ZM25_9TELE|nr:hypothetical protein [Pangasius djambal]